MASPIFTLALFFLLFRQTLTQGAADLVFEEGYSVNTVLDGDKYKFKVNPHSILPQYPPSDLFVLLDSVASTFYTVSLPTTSSEIVIQRLAGNSQGGYKDGNLDSAMFNRPKSFAVDYKGNIYVADKNNYAIRKIAKSGVSTIAGGSSQVSGHTDGAARNASFSNDFELTFVPDRCALMISDHGNRLIRQINLKAEDCTRQSGSVLGTTSLWLLGLGLSCIVSLIVGFVIRPYIIPCEDCRPFHWSKAWKRCLTSLERQTVMHCCDSRNAIVNIVWFSLLRRLITLSLSHLNLMFNFRISESHTTCQKSVSLLDFDAVCSSSSSSSSSRSSSNIAESPWVDDQLKDLLPFDEGLMLQANANEVIKQESHTTCQKSVSLLDFDAVCSRSRSSSSNIAESLWVDDQLKDLLPFDEGLMLQANANEVIKQEEEKGSPDFSSDKHEKIDNLILSNLINFEEQTPRVWSAEYTSGLVKRK